MKNIKFLIITLACFIFSCKKEALNLGDFAPVRNSIRAWNEITTIAEMYNEISQTGLKSVLTNKVNISSNLATKTGDSGFIELNFGSKDTLNIGLDDRFRSGKLRFSVLHPLTDTNNEIKLSFINYVVNNVQITGNLTLKESGKAANLNTNMFKLKITGNLTFTLANNTRFKVSPNLLQNYVASTNWYIGNLSGTDVEGNNFNCEVEKDIYKTTGNECKIVLYNGRYKLTSNNKIGKVWFGYKPQCDDYGFAEWNNKKYNFWLRDY